MKNLVMVKSGCGCTHFLDVNDWHWVTFAKGPFEDRRTRVGSKTRTVYVFTHADCMTCYTEKWGLDVPSDYFEGL